MTFWCVSLSLFHTLGIAFSCIYLTIKPLQSLHHQMGLFSIYNIIPFKISKLPINSNTFTFEMKNIFLFSCSVSLGGIEAYPSGVQILQLGESTNARIGRLRHPNLSSRIFQLGIYLGVVKWPFYFSMNSHRFWVSIRIPN